MGTDFTKLAAREGHGVFWPARQGRAPEGPAERARYRQLERAMSDEALGDWDLAAGRYGPARRWDDDEIRAMSTDALERLADRDDADSDEVLVAIDELEARDRSTGPAR